MTAFPVASGTAFTAAGGSGSGPPGAILAPDVMYAKIRDLSPLLDVVCRFNKVSDTELRLYRPVTSDGYWQEVVMRNSAPGPYCWNETAIRRYMTVTTAASANCTYTGTWTNLGSASPTTYTGGLGKQGDNGNSSEFVDITFDGPGDLYVFYTGRTLGAYFRVEVDGSTNNATELPSNGTYRYIDTYNAVDNTYKSVALVTKGLSAGAHTIRLICTGDRNPANTSGFRQVFEAIAVVGAGSLPGTAGTDLPLWQQNTAYAQWAQIRTSAGRYYSASVGGTSSTVEPTHTSGTATDGTVTWTFMNSTSYPAAGHIIQAPGSELEYAYWIQPAGATVENDVGGLLHGNEEATAVTLDADGDTQAMVDIPAGTWISADSLLLSQTIKTTHSETGATDIVATVKTLTVTSADVTVTHQHTFNVDATVGIFYAAMWPLLHWHASTENRFALSRLWTQKSGTALASSYYGNSNAMTGNQADYLMASSGNILMPKGTSGTPSALPPLKAVACALYVTPESVENFQFDTVTKAGKDMNIAGTTAPSVSSVVMKMYFGRNNAPRAVTAATVWSCTASYAVSVVPLNSTLPF